MVSEIRHVPLGDVAVVRSGYAFKSQDWTDSGIPVVKIANVKDGRLDMTGSSYVSTLVAESAVEFNLTADDILIAMTGYVGDVAWVRESELPAVLNQRVGRFTILDERRLEKRYLFYLLRSSLIRQEIEGLGYGSAQPNVSPTLIHGVEVPLPPIDEQRAIAHILGTLDDKIELNRRMNETLEEMARALFKSWFVDFDPVRAKAEGRDPGLPADVAGLFPNSLEDSDLGEIPSGWCVEALEGLLVLQRGFDLPATQRTPGQYPVLAASGPSGTHNEFMVRGPGVTTGRSGVLGKVFYVQNDFWPLNTSLWVKEFKHSTPMFAYHFLQTLDLSRFNAGSAVPTLNRNHVHNLPTLTPPMEIVEYFESIAVSMQRRQKHNNEQSQTLATIRDTLLPKLISGELRVGEAERLVGTAV